MDEVTLEEKASNFKKRLTDDAQFKQSFEQDPIATLLAAGFNVSAAEAEFFFGQGARGAHTQSRASTKCKIGWLKIPIYPDSPSE